MTKADLHAQIDSMAEEEAAQVKLMFAPERPSRATSIEEIRKRTGTKPMSAGDFDRHFGSLPTDGRGVDRERGDLPRCTKAGQAAIEPVIEEVRRDGVPREWLLRCINCFRILGCRSSQ
jgi:hypothetical protein